MPARLPAARRGLLLAVAALGLTLAAPLATFGHAAPASAPARAAAAATTPFTLDLSSKNTWVQQTNFVQCVGTSMQMMLNMIHGTDDRSDERQLELQQLARAWSGSRPDGQERRGASVRGWMHGLNIEGGGPYRLVGSKELQASLRIAARAMRETNKPVGLLVWRGRHAWVMAGFTATADPRYTDDFEVTHVIVLDPLYPYGSRVWGPSPKPRESITIAELGQQFVPRGTRGSTPSGSTAATPSATADPTTGYAPTSWSQGMAGKYVIVVPYVSVEPMGMRAVAR